MKMHSRITGLILLLLGVIVLFANLSKPRIEALHDADILSSSLVGCASASRWRADGQAENDPRIAGFEPA